MRLHALWLVVATIAIVAACQPTSLEDTPTYPPLDTPVSCATHPHLCGAPLVDLGGGAHPRAFHIVFVGDGFNTFELDRYRAATALWQRALSDDDGSPAQWDPSLFHFWRVDLAGEDASVDDDILTNTPLASHAQPDTCCDKINVDAVRGALAVSAAIPVDASMPTPNVAQGAIVHVVDGLVDARANGGSGVINISVAHDARTLLHELGHAVFGLGDEYVDVNRCGDDVMFDNVHHDDIDLIAIPNINLSGAVEKWAGLSTESTSGAHRTPCHHKSANACIMSNVGDAFCAVCRAHVEERLAMRRCDPDRQPPRVVIDATLLPGGSRVEMTAYADDTRDHDVTVSFTVDDVPVDSAIIDLAALGNAAGVVRAHAVDAAGNVGVSPPLSVRRFLPTTPGIGGVVDMPGARIAIIARPAGEREGIAVKIDDDVSVASHADLLVRPMTLVRPSKSNIEMEVFAISADGRVRSEPALVTHTFTPPATAPAFFSVVTAADSANTLRQRTSSESGAMFSFSHSEPIVAVGAIIQKNDGDGGVIVRHEVPASTCPLSGLCRVLLPLSLPTGEVFVRFFVDDHNGHRTVKDDAWRPEVVDDALLTIDADIVDEFAYTAITVHAPKLPHALFGLAPSLDVRRTGVDVIEVLPIGVRSASMVVGAIIDDHDGQIVLTQRVSLTWPDIEPSPIAKRERQPVIHDPLPACTP